jgi:hypothetical protein
MGKSRNRKPLGARGEDVSPELLAAVVEAGRELNGVEAAKAQGAALNRELTTNIMGMMGLPGGRQPGFVPSPALGSEQELSNAMAWANRGTLTPGERTALDRDLTNNIAAMSGIPLGPVPEVRVLPDPAPRPKTRVIPGPDRSGAGGAPPADPAPVPVVDPVTGEVGWFDDLGRYASQYDLTGRPGDTLGEVPLGGYVRSLAENIGADAQLAHRIEQGAAGALSIGVGIPAFLAAVRGLRGDDEPSVVVVPRGY